MYGDWIVLCITLLCSQLTWCMNNLDSSHNIICQPLPQVVAVNGNGLPFFVELHQCQGQVRNSEPRIKKCTFDKFESVKVKITHSGHTSEDEYVTLKNHTSCKEQCSGTCSNFFAHDKNCHCNICPHAVAPAGHECPDDFTWDRETCKCKCNLKGDDPPARQKFNRTQCKYVCAHPRPCGSGRTFSPNTCRCISTSAVSGSQGTDSSQHSTLIAALLIEFFLLCLVFDIYLYHIGKGLMYSLRCKVCGKPAGSRNNGDRNNRDGNNRVEGLPLSENEENNAPTHGVRVGKNGDSHLAANPHQST